MRGISVIRGLPTPVVDLAALIGGVASPAPARFVLLRVTDRRVALAVDDVPGLRPLPSVQGTWVPLLSRASAAAVESLTTLDSQLLAVLDTARLVPPEAWAGLGGAA